MSFFHQFDTSRHREMFRPRTLGTWLVIAALFTLFMPSLPQASAAAKTTDLSTSPGAVTTGMLTRVTLARPRHLRVQVPPASRHHALPIHYPYATPQQHAAEASAATFTMDAPHVRGITPLEASTGIVHNFEGITAADQFNYNLTDFEPPDQGLCANSSDVLEAVNAVFTVYNSKGLYLNGGSLITTFEPLSGDTPTDPRCYYDSTTKTWFLSLLAFNTFPVGESHLDLAVFTDPLNVYSWNIYQIDTTDSQKQGCPCYGDQPLLGVDAHGLFLSTNEYTFATSVFQGAQLYALDKKQLVAGAKTVYFVHYADMMNGGVMAASMEPAINSGTTPAEYFLDSLDPTGTTDNRLGAWAITNDIALDTMGTPTLSGIVISSETYGLPPNAAQKGTSNLLNADDDRMLQVQNVGGTLWSSLTTVVRPTGDTTNRAGAAWFEVVPTLSTKKPPTITGATITAQGIVSVKGNYLLYPAIAVNDIHNPAMVMSYSGSTIFPSVVYASGSTFSTLTTVRSGSTFDMGFTCSPCRWGDYSAAVWSTQMSGTRQPYIWMASAYIAGPPGPNSASNWATRVAEVIPLGG